MDKKTLQLGMSPSTASGRLIKDILWSLIVQTGKDSCCKCGEKMDRQSFSVEHTEPWLDSDNPVEKFFDLSNIAFSHLSCNVSAARRSKKGCGSHASYKRGCRCKDCVAANAAHSKAYYTPEGRRERYLRSEKSA